MKTSKRRAIVFTLLLPLLLTGCDYVAETETLLHPPTLNPQQAAVYAALETTLNIADIVYKPPVRGEYRSPFLFYDMDGDGQEEAVVFYSYKNDLTNTRFKLLQQDRAGTWYPVKDISAVCDQVDFVQFSPLLDKSSKCMIVGWQNTLSGSGRRVGSFLSVYALENGSLTTETTREEYQEYLVQDFDGDGLEEIVILAAHTSDRAPQNRTLHLSLLRSVGRHLDLVETLALSSTADSLLQSLVAGKLWDGSSAVYIDEQRLDGLCATEIVRVESAGFSLLAGDQPPGAEEKPEAVYRNYTQTLRESAIPSRDYNNDGRVEVPAAPVALPGNLYEGDDDPLTLTELMQLTQEGMSVVESAVINQQEGYLFFMPEMWRTWDVSVLRDDDAGVWRFYLLEPDNFDIRFELLQIHTKAEVLTEADAAGMIPLGNRGGRYFYGYIPLATPDMPSITESQLKAMFEILA